MLSFEIASSKYKLDPYNLEQFKEDNKGYAPMNIPTEVSDADWQIARRCIDGIERSLDSTIPSPGDVVIYTTENGDYRPYARVDYMYDDICIWEGASMYANEDGSCHASQASMSHSSIDLSLFKKLGYVYAPFWCFGSCDACAGGGIYFDARVHLWEYTEPNQKFPGYTTEKWCKWYVDTLKKSLSGYVKRAEVAAKDGMTVAFKTEEDYQTWLRTYRGKEFDGYWPEQKVVWGYRESWTSMDKPSWDKLDLPLDTRLCNAYIRDCKVKYDDDEHHIETYFYKVEDEHSSFWYSAESKYPFEFKLEREKNAKG